MGKIIGLIFEDTQDSTLTKAEIMERLSEKGIEFDEKAKKDELLSLLSES